jgi:NAD(P)-dependent dehydrogenase (short-subunit alcohol dehydrogenase family)
MALPIARELARFGIRIMTIAHRASSPPRCCSACRRKSRDSLGASVPFPSRLGQPEEYASLAMHIIDNAMLNGETIRLDGAIRMAPK